MVKARAGGGGKGLGGGEAVAMDVVALLNASPASPPAYKTHVLTLPSAPSQSRLLSSFAPPCLLRLHSTSSGLLLHVLSFQDR